MIKSAICEASAYQNKELQCFLTITFMIQLSCCLTITFMIQLLCFLTITFMIRLSCPYLFLPLVPDAAIQLQPHPSRQPAKLRKVGGQDAAVIPPQQIRLLAGGRAWGVEEGTLGKRGSRRRVVAAGGRAGGERGGLRSRRGAGAGRCGALLCFGMPAISCWCPPKFCGMPHTLPAFWLHSLCPSAPGIRTVSHPMQQCTQHLEGSYLYKLSSCHNRYSALVPLSTHPNTPPPEPQS